MATTLEEKAYSPEVGESQAHNGFTPEEEKQVLRKIDRVILPMVCTMYLFVSCGLLSDDKVDVLCLFPTVSRQAIAILCWRVRSHHRFENDQ